MPRKSTQPAAPATEASATEEVGTPTSGAVAKPVKAKKTCFDVYNPGNALVRTYSVEVHGEDAEELANQFAKKINGDVR